MATAAGDPPEAPLAANAERRFYTIYALALALIAFVGFAPTFFLRGTVPALGELRPLSPLAIAHGVAATVFILLFPIQAALISARRRALHIALGRWGFALGAGLLVPVYLLAMEDYHGSGSLAEAHRLTRVVAPLSLLPVLAVLLGLAWRHRYRAQAHKRLMIVIACVLVSPAIARFPFGFVPGGFSLPFYVFAIQPLMLASLIPLWLWDRRTLGRSHRMTRIGGGIFAFALVARSMLAPTALWAAFVAMLPGFGAP